MRFARNETDLLFPANLRLIAEARALDTEVDEGAAVEGLL